MNCSTFSFFWVAAFGAARRSGEVGFSAWHMAVVGLSVRPLCHTHARCIKMVTGDTSLTFGGAAAYGPNSRLYAFFRYSTTVSTFSDPFGFSCSGDFFPWYCWVQATLDLLLFQAPMTPRYELLAFLSLCFDDRRLWKEIPSDDG